MDALPPVLRHFLDTLDRIEFGGNSALRYLAAFLTFVAIGIALRLTVLFVISRLRPIAQRTRSRFDDVLLNVLGGIPGWLYAVLALYASSHLLRLPSSIEKLSLAAALAACVFIVGYVINHVIVRLMLRIWSSNENNEQIAGVLGVVINLILWTVGLVLILSNLGIEVTSLVASLGIGGVAVALASQGMLTDIFGSFALYFDKPFLIGDFIIIGEHRGVVRRIGLKTTRIQALEGEEIIIPNKELTSIRVRNFKRMRRRRVEFFFSVVYGTPTETLRMIPDIVKKIIDAQELCSCDRVHMQRFGDKALDFEVAYYFDSGDHNRSLAALEQIYLGILEEFSKHRIEMPYTIKPTPIEKRP
jgi:small-conductance mechanosensitive channel